MVLKFMDVDSYVYGETQLIYFVEIREHLRNKTKIELALLSLSRDQVSTYMLAETSKHDSSYKRLFDFPPIVQRISHKQSQSSTFLDKWYSPHTMFALKEHHRESKGSWYTPNLLSPIPNMRRHKPSDAKGRSIGKIGLSFMD